MTFRNNGCSIELFVTPRVNGWARWCGLTKWLNLALIKTLFICPLNAGIKKNSPFDIVWKNICLLAASLTHFSFWVVSIILLQFSYLNWRHENKCISWTLGSKQQTIGTELMARIIDLRVSNMQGTILIFKSDLVILIYISCH